MISENEAIFLVSFMLLFLLIQLRGKALCRKSYLFLRFLRSINCFLLLCRMFYLILVLNNFLLVIWIPTVRKSMIIWGTSHAIHLVTTWTFKLRIICSTCLNVWSFHSKSTSLCWTLEPLIFIILTINFLFLFPFYIFRNLLLYNIAKFLLFFLNLWHLFNSLLLLI